MTTRLIPFGSIEDLEALVDRDGLDCVLATLGLICQEKADHLRCNWQDETAARAWERASDKIDRLAHSERIEDVSTG